VTGAAIESHLDLLLRPLPLSHASIFDAIRSDGPVQWAPHLRAWLVTGYDESTKLLRHPAVREASGEELWRKLDGIAGIDSSATLKMLPYFPFWMGGAEHKRSREALTEIAKTLYGEIVDQAGRLAQGYLEEARRAGGFDLAENFASKLYPEAIFHALGIGPDKRASLRQVHELAAIFEAPRTTAQYRRIGQEFAKSHDILSSHVKESLRSGASSLIRAIAAVTPVAEDDSQVDAIARTLALLIATGSDTISGAIAYGVYELLSESGRDIEQKSWPEVAADVMRHVSSIVAMRRELTADIEIAGVHMRSGDPVVFAIIAANHDAALCGEDPHRIAIRKCGIGLAFGTGAHVCIGLRIGRSILHSALSALADAPRLRLGGEPVASDSPAIRVCKSMPMEFI
jgi:cytochrome P450